MKDKKEKNKKSCIHCSHHQVCVVWLAISKATGMFESLLATGKDVARTCKQFIQHELK